MEAITTLIVLAPTAKRDHKVMAIFKCSAKRISAVHSKVASAKIHLTADNDLLLVLVNQAFSALPEATSNSLLVISQGKE